MKLLVLAVAALLLLGSNVGAQQCYFCVYNSLVPDTDNCRPGQFDPSSSEVTQGDCSGKCYTQNLDVAGIITFTRACTLDATCGTLGIKCCDGNLCNGDSSATSLTGMTAMFTSLLSMVAIILFR